MVAAAGVLVCSTSNATYVRAAADKPRLQSPAGSQQCPHLRAQSFAAGATAGALLLAPAAHAAQAVAQTAEGSGALTLAVGGGAAIAALSAALVATDPDKRRRSQTQKAGGNEKEAVKSYFNTSGFERWKKIYGETDEVNKVQLDIRTGHAQTVEKVLNWLMESGGVKSITIADCGCGTGSLAVPLALQGAEVSASDISRAMASEAERRYTAAIAAGAQAPATPPKFEASDLESVKGRQAKLEVSVDNGFTCVEASSMESARYHTVTCLDVMIHYPQADVDNMIQHLASLAEQRLIISFAPKTLAYSILKRIGELFPGPSKATRAYLHREDDVEAALKKAGFKVTRKEMTATQFYFSRLFEAERV